MSMKLYYSVGGELLGESTGGAATTYMTDALGSAVGTATSAGVQNRYVYKPYGGTLAKTGTAPDPKFQWNARSRYSATSRTYSEFYLGARTYSSAVARFTTASPFWPDESPYRYLGLSPAAFADYLGLWPLLPPSFLGNPSRPPFFLPSPPRNPHPIPLPHPTPTPHPYPEPPHEVPPPEPGPELPPYFGVVLRCLGVIGLTLLPANAGPTRPGVVGFQFPEWITSAKPNKDPRHCDDLYNKYKASCAKADALGRCPPYSPTTGDAWEACALARMLYTLECDQPGGGAKKKNECKHASEICDAFSYAEECNVQYGEFPIINYGNAADWCIQVAKKCKGYRFPPGFGG